MSAIKSGRSIVQSSQVCLSRFQCRLQTRHQSTTTQPLTAQTSSNSLLTSLRKLSVQPNYYAKVHIQNKAYIVTKGDLIHLPIRLRDTNVGDTLSLTTLSSFGSRDYTLSAPVPSGKNQRRQFLEPGLGRVSATVVEHTKQPMVTTIKKKRRNRHAKAATHKQPYTVLRITHLELAQME